MEEKKILYTVQKVTYAWDRIWPYWKSELMTLCNSKEESEKQKQKLLQEESDFWTEQCIQNDSDRFSVSILYNVSGENGLVGLGAYGDCVLCESDVFEGVCKAYLHIEEIEV